MSSAPAPLTFDQAADPVFWRTLCPDLSVEGASPAPPARLPALEPLHRLLLAEGYVNAPDVLDPDLTARLFTCLRVLHQRGLPPAFAFVYDDVWLAFRSLAPFLESTLGPGYRILPAFWAWYVEPTDQASGWVPHRDRPYSLDPDGTPQSVTLWLPLSPATPLNGCMYVLPMHLDPRFQDREWRRPDALAVPPDRLQDIRALPATPGSLLCWNQALLHWGGRASRHGTGPRCSISVEFQRGDRPPLERGLFDPFVPLPLAARLGLIGHLTWSYLKFTRLKSPDVLRLARRLKSAFYPA